MYQVKMQKPFFQSLTESGKEDLVNFDQEVEGKFGDKRSFDVYMIVHDLDGGTVKAVLEELKIDAKRFSMPFKLSNGHRYK
ncbi:hypothetical protein [Planococcus shenhongbingii]|uniref:Uncharacterized protein n=1 Tax=Planococcus shenhongbingii TaxID=3058398 RepID=A0ABT8NG38_9BACL|nr:hypothetical protein [Planococcus sp. N017]MDN7246854.1 hypothetical protein [Planococcus sp. N017]